MFFIDSYIFLISLVLLSPHLTTSVFVWSLLQMQTEFLISCGTHFSCVALLTSSLFFLLYFGVVCEHWSEVGIDYVIKKRRKRHASPFVFFLQGDQSCSRCLCDFSHPLLSFHLWFMGCPSIFPNFFLFSFSVFFLVCVSFSSFVHLTYQCSWKTRSKLSYYVLPEHLYWLLTVGFLLH